MGAIKSVKRQPSEIIPQQYEHNILVKMGPIDINEPGENIIGTCMNKYRSIIDADQTAGLPRVPISRF